MRELLRVGAGAGFSGDRLEPATVLAQRGGVNYLVLECLGERTVALAQLRRHRDPTCGYDPLLERRVELLLPLLKRHGVRLISNLGAANPIAAGEMIVAIARRQKTPVQVAVVTGDDVLALIDTDKLTLEGGTPIAAYGELVSANAYLGIDALLPALQSGADV